MRALVTGARGWLGTNLVNRLASQDGWSVTALDLAARPANGGHGPVEHVVGDVSDVEVVRRAMSPRPDVVFHLAYLLGEEGQRDIPKSLCINCIGTANVFEAALEAGAGRTVWLSSSAIYGPAHAYGDELIGEEDVRGEPRLVYGACKRLNESIASSYARDRGLDHVAFRLSMGYGPPARRHGFSTQVTALFEAAFREEETSVVFPDALQNWVYVDDIVDALLLGAKAESLPRRIYNLASDETHTPAEVAEVLGGLLPGSRVEVTMEGPAEWPARLDYTKAREELGYRPRFDLASGIARYREAIEVNGVETGAADA
jgi:nucleoside-diphosphate-sugar epimerase